MPKTSNWARASFIYQCTDFAPFANILQDIGDESPYPGRAVQITRAPPSIRRWKIARSRMLAIIRVLYSTRVIPLGAYTYTQTIRQVLFAPFFFFFFYALSGWSWRHHGNRSELRKQWPGDQAERNVHETNIPDHLNGRLPAGHGLGAGRIGRVIDALLVPHPRDHDKEARIQPNRKTAAISTVPRLLPPAVKIAAITAVRVRMVIVIEKRRSSFSFREEKITLNKSLASSCQTGNRLVTASMPPARTRSEPKP